MTDTIAYVRRRRSTVRGRLPRIKRDSSVLEEKEKLTPYNQRKIKRLKYQVKENEQDFEQEHQYTLDSEEVFDEHENRLTDIIERLQKLYDLN